MHFHPSLAQQNVFLIERDAGKKKFMRKYKNAKPAVFFSNDVYNNKKPTKNQQKTYSSKIIS
jgi:hypothetical protein